MHPRLETVQVGLLPDHASSLSPLRSFVVVRGLAGCGQNWREVSTSFGDDCAFIDFIGRYEGGKPRVLLQFGVHDIDDRRVVGFFDAYWDSQLGDFTRIENAVIEGEVVDTVAISSVLTSYLTLPLLEREVVSMQQAA